ncbi:hypothetical protein ACFL0M_02140 [Thermodesulfobacteriota bacterium]
MTFEIVYNTSYKDIMLQNFSQGGIYMIKLQDQLKSIAKSLTGLSKQVEKISKQASKLTPPKQTKKKKAGAKKTVAKKPTAKKRVAKKTAIKKTTAAKKKNAPQKTVIDTVLGLIKRSRKGAAVAALKEKSGLGPRQLSNALYKLSTRGVIIAKSRGLYVIK